MSMVPSTGLALKLRVPKAETPLGFPADTDMYILETASEGAAHLSLIWDELYLKPGDVLWLCALGDESRAHNIRRFDSKAGAWGHKISRVSLVPGDRVVVFAALRAPSGLRYPRRGPRATVVRLHSLVHAHFSAVGSISKSLEDSLSEGTSNSCNVDINCPLVRLV